MNVAKEKCYANCCILLKMHNKYHSGNRTILEFILLSSNIKFFYII